MSVASKLVLGWALFAALYLIVSGVSTQGIAQPPGENEPWLEPSDGMLPKMPDMLPQPSAQPFVPQAPPQPFAPQAPTTTQSPTTTQPLTPQPTPFTPVPTTPGQPQPINPNPNLLPQPGQPVLR